MQSQTEKTPHNVLTGGFKMAPDYNRLQQVGFSTLKHLNGGLHDNILSFLGSF